MAKNEYTEIIDSVGIEVEFSNFNRNDKNIQSIISKNLPGYKHVHDASCETPIATFANTGLRIDFEDDNDFDKLEQVCAPATIGGEIVSPIRNSCGPDWIKEIFKLCELLWDLGEDENSSRDSLHIHVNVSHDAPFFVIRNLLKLTATFEAILFRLGGMGRINRGIENNYCYMRPFLGNGIPIIQQNWKNKRRRLPIMIFDDLMNAKDKNEFFDRYGDSRIQAGGRTRYVVQRYMCVNFYPILTQGSFEFRTANKTLKPEYIIAWTNFCKALVEKAYSTRDEKSFEDAVRPLAENREISEEEFLSSLSYLSALDMDTTEVLTQIWNLSPTPEFDNILRYTHLENYPTYSGQYGDYLPAELPTETEVNKAEFTDVHALNREQRHWDNPPRIEPPRIARWGGVNIENAIRDMPQVLVNEQHFQAPVNNVPMHQITVNWWAEFDEGGEVFIAIRRSREDDNFFDISLNTYDEEGDEVNLVGVIRDNHTYFDFPFMAEQWYENHEHPENLVPNMEM